MGRTISSTKLLLLVLLGLHLCSLVVHGQCLTGNDNPPTMSDDAKLRLIEARFHFSLDSLRRVAELETEDNVFYSPHSLYEALGLAYFGALGTTENSLKRALRIPDNLSKLDLSRFYAYEKTEELLRKSNPNVANDYDYQMANRLFLSADKKLRECMLDFFVEELQPMDFKGNPTVARNEINNWVSNVTRNNINDFLPADAVDESTDAVLANAVYFKGMWQSKFDPKMTRRDAFHLGQDKMTITMFMRQNGSFNHMVSEQLGAHILQLPYKGETVSMYILLPPFVSASSGDSSTTTTTTSTTTSTSQPDTEKKQQQPQRLDGVRQLLQRIADPTSENAKELRDILENGMQSRDVELAIPKFKIERDLPTKDLLEAMGAHDIIDPKADYGAFTADGEKPIHLGSALHRAKIELTEEGTTAAAATALFTFRSSRPTEPAVFFANHPFVYFIHDRSTQAILFAGIYRKPSKK